MDLIAIFTTVADRASAETLAEAAVEAGLAACVQIDTIDSVYRWQGQTQRSPEFRLMFKALAVDYATLEGLILARHPYALPAVFALPVVAAGAAYAEWVAACSARAQRPPP